MLKNNGKQHLLFTLPDGFANVATSINDISVKPQKSVNNCVCLFPAVSILIAPCA